MKVEVAVLGYPSLISIMVSVDLRHHERSRSDHEELYAQKYHLRSFLRTYVTLLGFCGLLRPRVFSRPSLGCCVHVSLYVVA